MPPPLESALVRTVSKLSQIIVEISEQKRSLCVFEQGAYGHVYAVHLRLIGKPVVDFLFVLIAFFR